MPYVDGFKTRALWLAVRCREAVRALAARTVSSSAGEGVISLAIGVLIMAFLGAILWVAFKGTLNTATSNVSHQVSQIGN